MNNTFSLKRFGLLFKKHTLEHGNSYLLSTGVLTGLLLLILAFASYTSNGNLDEKVQRNIFVIFFLLAGTIFTSLTFADLGDKKKAIPVLTLPSSHFEKYLVSWVYTFVIFQLVFLGAFYMVDMLVLSMSKAPVDDINKLMNVFSVRTKAFVALIVYAVLHALAFWGAVFFQKLHFIKTTFVLFIAGIIIVVLNMPLLRLLINSKYILRGMPFSSLRLNESGRYLMVDVDPHFNIYAIIVFAAIVILLWTSAFFRFKEKEV